MVYCFLVPTLFLERLISSIFRKNLLEGKFVIKEKKVEISALRFVWLGLIRDTRFCPGENLRFSDENVGCYYPFQLLLMLLSSSLANDIKVRVFFQKNRLKINICTVVIRIIFTFAN